MTVVKALASRVKQVDLVVVIDNRFYCLFVFFFICSLQEANLELGFPHQNKTIFFNDSHVFLSQSSHLLPPEIHFENPIDAPRHECTFEHCVETERYILSTSPRF